MKKNNEISKNSSSYCPRCGGEVKIKITLGTGFCGVRTETLCENGCRLNIMDHKKMSIERNRLFIQTNRISK